MSKKYGFRRPLNKRYHKRFQTLLKTEGQHLYHHYWWLWRLLNWKKSVLVICKILGLFVNTLTAADKNALPNLDNFNVINSDAIIKETKKLLLIFLLHFWNLDQILKTLKKRRPSQLMYFGSYRLRKKNLVSENPSISDMENGPKCCWNLKASTFTISIDDCEGNWVGKSLS